MALLEADVNYKVAKDFCAKVSERAMGQEVMESLTPVSYTHLDVYKRQEVCGAVLPPPLHRPHGMALQLLRQKLRDLLRNIKTYFKTYML